MSDNTATHHSLLSLGLSQIEASVYLALAQGQPATALSLSRTLAIPRTSIYDTLTRLGEKRLVERVIAHKSTLYKASPLATFESLIKSQQDKLQSMNSALKSLETQLKPRIGDLKNTEVRYYQGEEGMRQMIWNCLRAKKEIVGYSVFGRVDIVGAKYYGQFVEEFDKRGLSDRVIANPTKRTMDYIFKDVKPGFHQLSFQNIKVLPEKKLFISGDTMIYNDVYAVAYWLGHEVVGVEIESADFVRHELSIFDLLWSLAKPISSLAK